MMLLKPAFVASIVASASAVFAQPASRPATQPVDVGPAVKMPYTLEHFAKEGPVAGVVVKLDLTDPRVHVKLSLTDDHDPDGDGPFIGKLDTVLNAAERQHLAIATNASYFRCQASRVVLGKAVGYFVGNGARPVGFLFIDGKLLGAPEGERLRAVLEMHNDGRFSIEDGVQKLPDDVKYAVSGSAKILTAGNLTPPAKGRRASSADGRRAQCRSAHAHPDGDRRPAA